MSAFSGTSAQRTQLHILNEIARVRGRGGRGARGLNRESVGRNNQLGVGVAAHTVDSTRGASSDRIGVAAWMLGGHGNGAIRAAQDGTLVIKWIGTVEVDDEASVLRIAHKGDGGADLNAEDFVGFCVGYARGRGGIGAPAAPDVDGTGSGRGTTRVLCGAHACGIRSRTGIVLNFLFGVLTDHITGE